uniref:Odorant receptor n=1 Tax=Adelphocoris lineolatus TaxID=236346 RepID=A0A2I4PHH7_ADELI|nr:olfactory receptor 86 [Adelphocoris lineolatus]
MKTVLVHEDIAKFIHFMKARTMWYGTTVPWDDSLFDRFRKSYTDLKWLFCLLFFFMCGFSLSFADNFGLFDGTFIYWPICFMMTLLTSIAKFTARKQDVLMTSLNDHFLRNTEPWMRSIKDDYIKSLWKFIHFFSSYQLLVSILYMVVPFVADLILHYGFDYLESPISMPTPLSPIIKYNNAWNVKHFAVTVVNLWAFVEVVLIVQWFIANFSLTTVFVLTELIIFKHQVKSLNFEDEDNWEQQVKNIVDKHNQMIRLCKDLKDYLGLSSALVCFFTSLVLTFTTFTMYASSDITLRLSYGCGFSLYFSSALLNSYLGQKLENESDEVFKALYGLRWYRFKPEARKSLNMMMRQARDPLIIDFHGRYKMNLSNFIS